MLSLEAQLERLADAAFDDTTPAEWAPPQPRRNRLLLIAAACALLATLVGGLVVVNGRDDPLEPVDTTPPQITVAPTPTEPDPPPAATTTVPNLLGDASVFDDPLPYVAAIETASGAELTDITSAISQAERRALADCVTEAGWIVEPIEMVEALDSDVPVEELNHAEVALLRLLRIQSNPRSSLWQDEEFTVAVDTCATPARSTVPELRQIATWSNSLPSFSAEADQRFVDAQAASVECLEDSGYAPGVDPFDEFSQRSVELLDIQQSDPDAVQQSIDALMDLGVEEDDRRAELRPCFANLDAIERLIVAEQQQDYLDANPDAVEELERLVEQAGDVQDGLMFAEAVAARTATLGGTGDSATIFVWDSLSEWEFEAFDNGSPAEPTFFLWPGDGDGQAAPVRIDLTQAVGAKPAEARATLIALDFGPDAPGSERMLVDIISQDGEATSLVGWEWIERDATGLMQQRVSGILITAVGDVVEFNARGIGLATLREMLAFVSVT